VADKAHLDRLARELAEQGKLIEAGWIGLRLACDLHDAPAGQLDDMRNAFFAGAQHLLGSIQNGILDPDAEPTEGDLRRFSLIDQELREFIQDFELRYGIIKGSA
jgi:hypothetical protein